MEIKIGPPVTGEDFFGRQKELEYVWALIKGGNNLIFPSPRRVGKTSFALRILEEARSSGWQTIDINLESCRNEQAFIEQLVSQLRNLSTWEKIKDEGNNLFEFLSKFKPSVEANGLKVSLEWNTHKREAYNQLNQLLNHDEPMLIFLDEVTVLLTSLMSDENGHKETETFLHWLRGLRIEKKSKIKWILCSSVGIENFTHAYNLSATLNDTHRYELKSFSRKESEAMLDRLAQDNKIPLTIEHYEQILDKLHYFLPFFLQLIFEKIKYLHEVEEVSLDVNMVNKAYQQLCRGDHFNTWVERINLQYGRLSQKALGLLNHLCQAKNGIQRNSLLNHLIGKEPEIEKAENDLNRLLYMLSNDGYLSEEEGFYRFRSPLLRDFWLQRFVK